MKKLTVFWSVLLILLTISFLNAQNVQVTFRVNTSTVPDTVTPNTAVVQVRGGTAPLTWGNDTGGQMTNVGGDYWEVTLEFPASATSAYKFFVNAAGNGDGNGWESGNDLQLTLGTADTTLPLHYFRKLGSADPFTPPFEETEMMDVWFRVNVHRLIQDNAFSPATQIMMLKGGTWPGSWGDLTWNGDSAKTILAPEVGSDNAGQFVYQADYFWSGRVRIPQDSVDEGQKIEYKFVIADKNDPTSIAAWEEIDNRSFNVPQGYADTTLLWNFWMNRPPLEATGEDTVKVKFVTDLTRAISENGFTPGDTVIVTVGRNASAIQEDHIMTRTNPLLFIYEATAVANNVEAGEFLQYQYYHRVAGLNVRENFYDFENTGLSQADQETRKIFIPSPAPDTTQVISVYDTVAASVTSGNRQPQFPNSQLLPNDALVYWECDLRPPYFHLKFGGDSILDEQGDENYAAGEHEQILQDGVWINGPATTDWTTWGAELRNTPEKQMWDDGFNGGDMTADDTVYTTTWYYSGPDSSDRIGVVYKFGLNGGDNEPGQGGFGLNHLINISTNAQKEIDTVTIRTAFGSVNPNFYLIWDFDADTVNWELTGIEDGFVQIIRKISLEQNYPNPFNPTTAIKFELPTVQDVKLIIYNSLGQEVATLLNGRQRQGTHLVYWNGLNKQDQPVASGVYFYKLSAENFTQVRKMLLIR